MSKRKNFGLKNFFFSLAAVVLSFYIFQSINGSVETMVAENGNLEDVIKADGIVIKDEQIYNASVSGSVTYYYEDGTKVKEGQLVADLNTDQNSAEINNQIAEIQTAIDKKKNTESGVTALSNETLSSYENEIQASILNNELDSMYNIVGQVNNNISIPSFGDSYEQYDAAQLEAMKANLSKSISTHKVPYYSGQAGLITYKIDGLENEYKIENVLSMTPSQTVKKDYIISDKKQSESAAENEGIFKIIKNFEYYIAATVDNEKAKLFEENKFIKTRILSDGTQHEVWGYIKKINYSSEQSVLILYFDDYFYKIYDKRYVDLELITDIYEGLKISAKALTELNGKTGVYVQDASNIIKFFPVEILGKDENFAIITTGEYIGEHDRRIIKINDESYPTVKIFDKIILEPENVYDGQIAD
ncbi:MAG: HlyD family efflux transporter periplasmic adaptor subunit [Sedimentibacter sp.]